MQTDETQPSNPSGARSHNVLYRVSAISKAFPVTGGVFKRKIGEVKALEDVNLSVHRSRTLGIVGESGCGKTTLGRIMALLERPTGGHLSYDFGSGLENLATLAGRDQLKFRRHVQMIFQDPYTALNPREEIWRQFDEPLRVHGLRTEKERLERIEEAFSYVNLRLDILKRLPHEFSGGQRQRICIARALCVRPELIIADEPVSALDVSIQAQTLNYLREVQRDRDVSYVFIAHDLSVVQYMSDEIVVLYLGKVVETFPSAELERARHPYTEALVSAIPKPEVGKRRERIVLSGDVPSPMNKPTGCPFVTRCPKRFEPCATVNPPLVEIEPGHHVACHLFPRTRQASGVQGESRRNL